MAKSCKARRDPVIISPNSVLYFCEDYFDLPNDMENYMEYHVMGSVSQVRMRSGCTPTRFECQPDRRKRTSTERPYVLKKQRKILIEDSVKGLAEESTPTICLEVAGSSSDHSVLHTIEEHQEEPKTRPKLVDKSVQVYIGKKFRSKAVQTEMKLVNQLTSPMKPDCCGYGGRVTDTSLVESCDFIRYLQPGMCVMADRGFKHVEQYLRKEGIKLVRPPSVVTGAKLSKGEVKETKQIASLRIHIERVIRRLREFNMLKPHACVNLHLVKALDEVIVIACALINLQDSLIK